MKSRDIVVPFGLMLLMQLGCDDIAELSSEPTSDVRVPEDKELPVLRPRAEIPDGLQRQQAFQTIDGSISYHRVTSWNGYTSIGDMTFGHFDDPTPISGGLDVSTRWPSGIVPFYFCSAATESINAVKCVDSSDYYSGNKAPAYAAMDTIERLVPGVRFVEDTTINGTDPHLVIMDNYEPSGNKASVGVGIAHLYINNDNEETFLHELFHTLGVKHEHQRSDRGDFVLIILGNIIDDKEDQFELVEETIPGSPYDYRSITHYGRTKFCNGEPGACNTLSQYLDFWTNPAQPTLVNTTHTIIAMTEPGISVLSDFGKEHLSEHDINGLSLMYSWGAGTASLDKFGSAVQVVDFDLDGYNDLAIGVPQADPLDLDAPLYPPTQLTDAGLVQMFKGTEHGLVPWHVLRPDRIGFPSTAGDRFGSSLASGDFNNDGYPDLAVGAPNSSVHVPDGGAAFVFFGNQSERAVYGAVGSPCLGWGAPFEEGMLATTGGTPISGDRLGWALVAGDVDRDDNDELIVGAPERGTRGAVQVVNPSGCADTGTLNYWVDGSSLGHATPPAGAEFGYALALGNLFPPPISERKPHLAVGAPGVNFAAVFEFNTYGTTASLRKVTYSPASPQSDRFGEAVAIGALAVGSEKLVVGAPSRDAGAATDAGAIDIFGYDAILPLQLESQVPAPFSILDDAEFGSSLLVADLGLPGPDFELLVGAPGHDGGTGVVTILAPTVSGLTVHDFINGPAGSLDFGESIATGHLEMKVPGFLTFLEANIVVGSPNALSRDFILGGNVTGWKLDTPGGAAFIGSVDGDSRGAFSEQR